MHWQQSHIPILKMLSFPSQWHFSEIKKLIIEIGNAQWVDGYGLDGDQEAFEFYEHLIHSNKANDGKSDSYDPDSYVGKPDA